MSWPDVEGLLLVKKPENKKEVIRAISNVVGKLVGNPVAGLVVLLYMGTGFRALLEPGSELDRQIDAIQTTIQIAIPITAAVPIYKMYGQMTRSVE